MTTTPNAPSSEAIAQAADRLVAHWNFHHPDAMRIAALILYPLAGAEKCPLCDLGVKRSHHATTWCEACNRTGFKPPKAEPAQEIAAQGVEGDSVLIPRASLKWWRELVDLNPADLAPRIDAYLGENSNG